MKTIIHSALCPQRYLAAYGLDPARVIYFDIETTGFRASTSRLYMIGWAVSEDSSAQEYMDGTDEKIACDSTMRPVGQTASGSMAGLDDRASSGSTTGSDDRASSGSTAAYETNDCGDWIVTQIMAESTAEEVLLLRQFSEVLSRYDTIIEFNGDRFDLPYMREKYEAYGMPDPFSNCTTVDLYREIKPYKSILGMSRLNQKSVEQFLHITREDPYNGGELIDVYRSVRDHTCCDEEGATKALFLHNYEDVLGMMDMTPLLAYRLAMESTAPVTIKKICKARLSAAQTGSKKICSDGLSTAQTGSKKICSDGVEISAENCGTLEAVFPLSVPVPSPLHFILGEEACEITISGDLAAVRLRLLPLCLYHYFPDYRNYYYLPEEDTAIHKSVASFVDPAHREKAKAQNCYIKKEGVFLPQAEEQYQPVFKRFYKDSVQWFEYQEGMEDDCETFSNYIHALIRSGK